MELSKEVRGSLNTDVYMHISIFSFFSLGGLNYMLFAEDKSLFFSS